MIYLRVQSTRTEFTATSSYQFNVSRVTGIQRTPQDVGSVTAYSYRVGSGNLESVD
jgi:hypothetical protein